MSRLLRQGLLYKDVTDSWSIYSMFCMVASIVKANAKRHDVHTWMCATYKDADSRQGRTCTFVREGTPGQRSGYDHQAGARHHVGLADWVTTWHWIELSISGVEIIIIGAGVFEKRTACSVSLYIRCRVLNVCRGRLSIKLSDIPDRRVYMWGCAGG